MANQDTLKRMSEVARLQYWKAKEQAFVASLATSVTSGGGVGGAGTGGAGVGTEPIIEPGREVVLELQNDGTDAAPGSIGVVYLEREDL